MLMRMLPTLQLPQSSVHLLPDTCILPPHTMKNATKTVTPWPRVRCRLRVSNCHTVPVTIYTMGSIPWVTPYPWRTLYRHICCTLRRGQMQGNWVPNLKALSLCSRKFGQGPLDASTRMCPKNS